MSGNIKNSNFSVSQLEALQKDGVRISENIVDSKPTKRQAANSATSSRVSKTVDDFEISGTFPVTGYVVPLEQGESTSHTLSKRRYSLSSDDDALLILCITFLLQRDFEVKVDSDDPRYDSIYDFLRINRDRLSTLDVSNLKFFDSALSAIKSLFSRD